MATQGSALGYGAAGGIGGLAVGATVSAIQAAQARKEAARMRRRTRKGMLAGVESARRSVGGIVSSPEYQAASNFVRQFFGLGNAAPDISEALSVEYGGGPSDDVAARLRRGKFAEGGAGFGMGGVTGGPGGAADTLTADFVKGLRAAQTARGLFESQAGGAAEASGMAAFRANLQMQLLPQLFGLAEGPARLRAQYEPGAMGREVALRTGGQSSFGPSVLGSALEGGMAGLFSGASLGVDAYGSDQSDRIAQLEEELARLRPR